MHRHTSHCTRGLSLEARLLHFLPERPDGACWVFDGPLNQGGYGLVTLRPPGEGTKQYRAHRLAYEVWVGPIPDGLTVDHVAKRGCVSKACCNPAHLEAVTNAENSMRSGNPLAQNARRNRCVNGHEFDEERRVGDRVYRGCSVCRLERGRRHDAKRRKAAGL